VPALRFSLRDSLQLYRHAPILVQRLMSPHMIQTPFMKNTVKQKLKYSALFVAESEGKKPFKKSQ
jgi:hypothetical protein